jgi:hypothetical protein
MRLDGLWSGPDPGEKACLFSLSGVQPRILAVGPCRSVGATRFIDNGQSRNADAFDLMTVFKGNVLRYLEYPFTGWVIVAFGEEQ